MASKDVKKLFEQNSGLYVITDIDMAKPRSYYEIVRDVLLGGARIIQVRDKKTPFEPLLEICKKLKTMCDEFDALLIINDNPYLAKASDAHGVHIGQEDTPIEIAREIVGNDKLIGLSTHTKAQAIESVYQGVDYIGIGPIYATKTKMSQYPPLSSQICSWIKSELHIPFVAIGGITLDNLDELVKAGADYFAVISAVMASKNIEDTVREFVETINIYKEVFRK